MEFSFYAEDLGKRLCGQIWVAGGIITVTSDDGRQKKTQLGASKPEMLARILLRELEAEKP